MMTTRRHPHRRCRRRHARSHGFTLIELLVVLGIILVLVGILIPTVKTISGRAQETTVRAQIASLDAAIMRYQQDFTAYPGPLARGALGPNGTPGISDAPAPNGGGQPLTNVTGAENLALGLLGGLKPVGTAIQFDKTVMGRGPRGLNPANPKGYNAYIEGLQLSEGLYKDGAGAAMDSVIPEILDKFGSPMPILYLRAQTGARGVVSFEGQDGGNAVFTPAAPTQYDIREIIGYTQSNNGQSIGEGKTIRRDAYVNFTPAPSDSELPHGLKSVDSSKKLDKTAGTDYTYPYDAFPYFQNRAIPPTVTTNPNGTGTPRNKNKYILISAGADRVYGTSDDITNFGSVLE